MKKPGIDVIVGGLPPPGKLRPARPKPGAAEDAADGGADDAEEGDDYNPAEDSAAAFAEALGVPADKVDGAKVLDAFKDLLKNARE